MAPAAIQGPEVPGHFLALEGAPARAEAARQTGDVATWQADVSEIQTCQGSSCSIIVRLRKAEEP